MAWVRMGEDTVCCGRRSPGAENTGKKLFSVCGFPGSRVLCRRGIYFRRKHISKRECPKQTSTCVYSSHRMYYKNAKKCQICNVYDAKWHGCGCDEMPRRIRPCKLYVTGKLLMADVVCLGMMKKRAKHDLRPLFTHQYDYYQYASPHASHLEI